MAARHRAGEGDEIDGVAGDDPLGVLMREMEILEDAVGSPAAAKASAKALGAKRRLMRMLENDRVAGEDRGNNCVDRGEIGIVPRRTMKTIPSGSWRMKRVKPVFGSTARSASASTAIPAM